MSGLVGGQEGGTISTCYVKGGSSTGGANSDVGGLVGVHQRGTIRACYVFNRSLSGGTNAGILVGTLDAGSLIASYAGGKNYTKLIGRASNSPTITNSYFQIATSSGNGKTETELKMPTGYSGIYANWNLDLNNDSTNDDPWAFGGTSAYPKLKVDFNSDGTATTSEFGSQ